MKRKGIILALTMVIILMGVFSISSANNPSSDYESNIKLANSKVNFEIVTPLSIPDELKKRDINISKQHDQIDKDKAKKFTRVQQMFFNDNFEKYIIIEQTGHKMLPGDDDLDITTLFAIDGVDINYYACNCKDRVNETYYWYDGKVSTFIDVAGVNRDEIIVLIKELFAQYIS